MHGQRRSTTDSSNVAPLVRRGFSLLEVILALALTALVVAAISMSIHLHLFMLTEQQDGIEQAHVSRNVLEVLAIDIRAAMQYKPFDADTVDIEEAAENNPETAAAAAAAAGGDPTAGGGAAGGAGAADGEGSVASDPTQPEQPPYTEDIQGSATFMAQPGFYGNSKEIMFNLSRLPRMDQYNPYVLAGDQGVNVPTDIKTTSYFLDLTGQLGGDPLTGQTIGGLYRRQMAHAHAAFAAENGYTLSSDATTELLATEVVDLQFRYWGNDDWQDEWDSDVEGGFPTAVEITIIIDPRRKEGEKDLPEYTGFDEEYMSVHRKVVHLPVAEMLSEEELNAIQQAQQSVVDAQNQDSEGGGDQ